MQKTTIIFHGITAKSKDNVICDIGIEVVLCR